MVGQISHAVKLPGLAGARGVNASRIQETTIFAQESEARKALYATNGDDKRC